MKPIFSAPISVLASLLAVLPPVATAGPNLLSNPSGQGGATTGWTVIASGGNGWATNGASNDGDGVSFITSFDFCRRSQTIDLLAAGYTLEYLDGAPAIRVREAFRGFAGASAADFYYLRVELRDANGAVLDSWNAGTQASPLVASATWQVQEHLFENYPAGVRQIYWEDGGDDAEYWAGHYGALLDAAVLEFVDPVPTAIRLVPGTYPVGAAAGGVAGYFETDDNEGATHVYALAGETQPVALIPVGAAWAYLDNGSDQGTAWKERVFDDSAWVVGNAELGYGEGDEATPVGGLGVHITNYFRHRFTLTAGGLAGLQGLGLRLKRDDGAVVYLNGTEVARDGMPAGTILFNTAASGAVPDDGQLFHDFSLPLGALREGENVVAVEIHQPNLTSSDASFDLELIGDAVANNYDNALFSINGDQLVFAQSGPAVPVTVGGMWTVNVRVTDNGGNALVQTVTVTGVPNPTQAPTAIAVNPASITEGLPAGTEVGILTSTDADPGDLHVYTLVSGAGSGGNGFFRIEGRRLVSDAVLNAATQPTLAVRVRSTDRGGFFTEQSLTIQVRDVNDPPTGINFTGTTVPNSAAVGTLVGLLTTVDPDAGDIHTYGFVPTETRVTLFGFGSTWRFLDDGSDLGAAVWTAPGYSDAAWKSGPGSFGYGDAQVTPVDFGPTSTNKRITTYFRRGFTLTAPSAYDLLELQVLRDDGVAVYLNGAEVARNNLAIGAGATTLATAAIGGVDETTPVVFPLVPGAFAAGSNTLAAEIHQSAIDSSDLTFDLALIGVRDGSGATIFTIANGNEIRTSAGFQAAGFPVGTLLGLVLRSTDDRGAAVERTFSVTVISSDPNDADGDQLPDSWELLYFPNLTGQNGSDDSDGDGQTNRQEYVFGTLPNARGSLLTLEVLPSVAGTRPVRWPSVTGRRYRLQLSPSMQAGTWADSPAGQRQGTGSQMMETIPDGGVPTRVFRLLVEMP